MSTVDKKSVVQMNGAVRALGLAFKLPVGSAKSHDAIDLAERLFRKSLSANLPDATRQSYVSTFEATKRILVAREEFAKSIVNTIR